MNKIEKSRARRKRPRCNKPLTSCAALLGKSNGNRQSQNLRHHEGGRCGALAELDADAVGLNFYAGSPRFVSLESAGQIVLALPPFVEPVGVFVNETMERIRATASNLGLRTYQWYGVEPAEFEQPDGEEVIVTRNGKPVACLVSELPVPLRSIPAFAVRDEQSLQTIAAYLDRCRGLKQLPAAILVNAHVPGSYGGTGQTLPWELLADFRPGVPFILAGGLTPDNVADAVCRVRPYAVNVASGVEISPGIKDPEKMRLFIERAKAASRAP